ncbi:MAG: hypothetical protein K6T17_08970, partial [Fimbriimonadales bacterium]|nr:hypothetical protein [Fimbriimonadales bacterium]
AFRGAFQKKFSKKGRNRDTFWQFFLSFNNGLPKLAVSRWGNIGRWCHRAIQNPMNGRQKVARKAKAKAAKKAKAKGGGKKKKK